MSLGKLDSEPWKSVMMLPQSAPKSVALRDLLEKYELAIKAYDIGVCLICFQAILVLCCPRRCLLRLTQPRQSVVTP